jgi:hypothetical protein
VHLLRNPRTRVLHAEPDTRRARPHAFEVDTQDHLAVRRELHGVPYQIHENLPQPAFVSDQALG